MSRLDCRCPGFEGDVQCQSPATQEDGLCDGCRCEHGCCVDHGHPKVGMSFEEWMERDWWEMELTVLEAWRRWSACKEVTAEANSPR